MESLIEAWQKYKKLDDERLKVIDILIDPKTELEIKEYRYQLKDLTIQIQEVQQEINRLSNGNIYFSKRGSRIRVRPNKKG